MRLLLSSLLPSCAETFSALQSTERIPLPTSDIEHRRQLDHWPAYVPELCCEMVSVTLTGVEGLYSRTPDGNYNGPGGKKLYWNVISQRWHVGKDKRPFVPIAQERRPPDAGAGPLFPSPGGVRG